MAGIESVVFDVGGVLLDWDPRYLYRKVFSVEGTVEILDELRVTVRLFALSNWPAERAPDLRETYRFFDWFDRVVISGEERIAKPEPEVFHRLCDRYALDPHGSLRHELESLGLLATPT